MGITSASVANGLRHKKPKQRRNTVASFIEWSQYDLT